MHLVGSADNSARFRIFQGVYQGHFELLLGGSAGKVALKLIDHAGEVCGLHSLGPRSAARVHLQLSVSSRLVHAVPQVVVRAIFSYL